MTNISGYSSRPTNTLVVSGLVSFLAFGFTSLPIGMAQGTGGHTTFDYMQHKYGYRIPEHKSVGSETTAENDLVHIRKILNPSVTELASALNVSRQAIYDWQSGTQIKPENFAKLKGLATAADKFASKEAFFIHQTLRRKIGGKNFFARLHAGENAKDVALQLLDIANTEASQRAAISLLLKNRPVRTELIDVPGPHFPNENG